MEEKKSFVLYMSWKPAIDEMTDEQAGKLFKAIYNLQDGAEVDIRDQTVRAVLGIIRETMAKDGIKYAETKEKRKAAIRARWENKQIQTNTNEYKSIQTNTNEYKSIQTNTNETVSVSDSVSVSVSDSVSDSVSVSDKDNNNIYIKEGKRKKKAQAPPTLDQITEYVKEKGLNVDPEQFFNYFDAGNWIDAKGQKVRSWKQKLLTWNKYDSQKNASPEKKNKFNNFEQRDYDFDELTKRLVRN